MTKKKNQTVKKNEEFQMAETKEMDLKASEGAEQGNDSQPSEPIAISDLDRLIDKFPEVGAEKLMALLKDMPYNDAVYVLEEEASLPQEIDDEHEPYELKNKEFKAPMDEPEVSNKQEPEVKQMTEETETKEMTVDEKFNAIMADQNKMQKDLEQKKGGVTSVDDTVERADRATQVSIDGRRRGKVYKPNKGVAIFMATQNAKYKASGKPAPYSDQCIKNTLMREEGVLKGKA